MKQAMFALYTCPRCKGQKDVEHTRVQGECKQHGQRQNSAKNADALKLNRDREKTPGVQRKLSGDDYRRRLKELEADTPGSSIAIRAQQSGQPSASSTSAPAAATARPLQKSPTVGLTRSEQERESSRRSVAAGVGRRRSCGHESLRMGMPSRHHASTSRYYEELCRFVRS